jgi:drug/metabolite transporter (DMT)-like permease
MEARQSIPGLNRNENDAMTAIAMFALGMLTLLCGTVLALHLLSGLPAVMTYAILFSVMVFTMVCGAAFLRAKPQVPRGGPPQLEFRSPVRRRPARHQKMKPLA